MTEATAVLLNDNGAAATAAAPTTGAAPTGAWNEGFDTDTSAYVTNKGWQTPSDVLSSYRNLEKFAGGSKNLVEMPGVDADSTAMDAFYGKLGRPATPDAYGITVPDGGDAELAGWFKQSAHKMGLTDKQASGLFNEWNGMASQRAEAGTAASQQQSEKAVGDLKREWGQGYDAQIDMGKRAVSALGYDEARLSALEDKMGTSEMLKLFATMGSKMGEPAFEGGDRSGSSFGVTPAQANQQISDLKMDKSFMDQYLKGNPDAVGKMTRLMNAAHGGR